MKNSIFVLLLLSVPVMCMDSQYSPHWEAKMAARRVRFFERLPHFNSAIECDNEMTTESEADAELEEGIISQKEFNDWRAQRTAERITHDQQIKARTKNARVEAVLSKVTLNDNAQLYSQLNNNYKNVPALDALKALGYEADAE
jgi:hypothetical protein